MDQKIFKSYINWVQNTHCASHMRTAHMTYVVGAILFITARRATSSACVTIKRCIYQVWAKKYAIFFDEWGWPLDEWYPWVTRQAWRVPLWPNVEAWSSLSESKASSTKVSFTSIAAILEQTTNIFPKKSQRKRFIYLVFLRELLIATKHANLLQFYS